MKLDVDRLANAKAKGKRPWFFTQPEAERVLNITLALAQEVAVLRARLDTLERLLEQKGHLARAEIEAYVPTPQAADERSAWTQSFLARVLRIIQQELEALEERPQDAVSIDELSKE